MNDKPLCDSRHKRFSKLLGVKMRKVFIIKPHNGGHTENVASYYGNRLRLYLMYGRSRLLF